MYRQPLQGQRNRLFGLRRNRYQLFRAKNPYYLQRSTSGPGGSERSRIKVRPRKDRLNRIRDRSRTLQKNENTRKNIPFSNKITEHRNPNVATVVSGNNLRRLSAYAGRSKNRNKSKELKNGQSNSPQKLTNFFKRPSFPVWNETDQRFFERRNFDSFKIPSVSTTQRSFIEVVFPPSLVQKVHDRSLTTESPTTKAPPFVKGLLNLEQVRHKLRAVLLIPDESLKRDAMKDLVKGIVSRSGILLANQTAIDTVDMATLDNILELIKSISNKLQEESDLAKLSSDSIIHVVHTAPQNQKGNQGQRTNGQTTASNINNVLFKNALNLPNQSGGGATANKAPFKEEPQSLKHLAGKSIFGARPKTAERTDSSINTPTKTFPELHSGGRQGPIVVQINNAAQVTQTTTQSSVSAPMLDFINDTGDSLQYWGHLTAGLADLLCSYCTQRGFQGCINRHCTRAI